MIISAIFFSEKVIWSGLESFSQWTAQVDLKICILIDVTDSLSKWLINVLINIFSGRYMQYTLDPKSII